MNEKNIEIYYDHYKNTFEVQKEYIKKRNLYYFISLILLTVVSFQITNPDQTIQISNELIKQKIGEITISYAFINSLLLLAFLSITMMYFQINLIIERYYKYIQKMEESISEYLTPFKIDREGGAYLNQYPWISTLVHYIYTIVYPIIIIIVSILKWKSEINLYKENLCNGHFIFDIIIIILIIILTVLYLIKLYFNDFKKKT
jgi:hypothetical protein